MNISQQCWEVQCINLATVATATFVDRFQGVVLALMIIALVSRVATQPHTVRDSLDLKLGIVGVTMKRTGRSFVELSVKKLEIVAMSVVAEIFRPSGTINAIILL